MAATLPPPLVTFKDDPRRWLRNKALLTVDAVVLAHVGVLIVAALYYLVTQTNADVKHWWDTTVTPSALRHDIRDVGEGVLASCLAQAIVWNPFTRSHQKAGRTLRAVRQRLHLPVGLVAVASAAAVGAVAFIAGEAALHALSVHAASHTANGSLWHRTATLWNSNWDKKALGFGAAVVARRPLHILFDNAQAYFVDRRADAGRGLRFYDPPVFRARYNDLTASRHEVRRYSPVVSYVIGIVVAAAAGLAGFGFYVLTYKA